MSAGGRHGFLLLGFGLARVTGLDNGSGDGMPFRLRAVVLKVEIAHTRCSSRSTSGLSFLLLIGETVGARPSVARSIFFTRTSPAAWPFLCPFSRCASASSTASRYAV